MIKCDSSPRPLRRERHETCAESNDESLISIYTSIKKRHIANAIISRRTNLHVISAKYHFDVFIALSAAKRSATCSSFISSISAFSKALLDV